MKLYEVTIAPKKFNPQKARSPEAIEKKFGIPSSPKFGTKHVPRKPNPKNLEQIGRGSYGSAFSSKQEPGTVRKVVGPISESEFQKDAYFKYVQLLTKNDRFTMNPYFPRVYDIQVKKFPLEPTEQTTFYDYMYAVDIERLHEYSTLTNEEGLMLGKLMFYNFKQLASKFIEVNSEPKGHGRYDKGYARALILFISRLVDDPYHPEKTMTVFKDPKLKQATMLLRKLREDSRSKGISLFFDIRAANVMVRRGRGIPQLVFTDPVAS